ncbi:MAG: hypothetical protein AVDCRST_MAG48-1222, partial [uncultured Friedmanniella sp.]
RPGRHGQLLADAVPGRHLDPAAGPAAGRAAGRPRAHPARARPRRTAGPAGRRGRRALVAVAGDPQLAHRAGLGAGGGPFAAGAARVRGRAAAVRGPAGGHRPAALPSSTGGSRAPPARPPGGPPPAL